MKTENEIRAELGEQQKVHDEENLKLKRDSSYIEWLEGNISALKFVLDDTPRVPGAILASRNVTIPASEERAGQYKYTCTKCNHEYWSFISVNPQPVCISCLKDKLQIESKKDGVKYVYVCKDCGFSFLDPNRGLKLPVCPDCQLEYTDEALEKLKEENEPARPAGDHKNLWGHQCCEPGCERYGCYTVKGKDYCYTHFETYFTKKNKKIPEDRTKWLRNNTNRNRHFAQSYTSYTPPAPVYYSKVVKVGVVAYPYISKAGNIEVAALDKTEAEPVVTPETPIAETPVTTTVLVVVDKPIDINQKVIVSPAIAEETAAALEEMISQLGD